MSLLSIIFLLFERIPVAAELFPRSLEVAKRLDLACALDPKFVVDEELVPLEAVLLPAFDWTVVFAAEFGPRLNRDLLVSTSESF